MTKTERDVKCHGCGASDDRALLRVYPWPDKDDVTEEPIGPDFYVSVSPRDGEAEDDHDFTWRRAVVCHACFHALDLDLWISRGTWESLRPVTPFGKLPLPKD